MSITNYGRVGEWKTDGDKVSVVGVHVRRGDYIQAFGHQGLREATAAYYRAIARVLDAASNVSVSIYIILTFCTLKYYYPVIYLLLIDKLVTKFAVLYSIYLFILYIKCIILSTRKLRETFDL